MLGTLSLQLVFGAAEELFTVFFNEQHQRDTRSVAGDGLTGGDVQHRERVGNVYAVYLCQQRTHRKSVDDNGGQWREQAGKL